MRTGDTRWLSRELVEIIHHDQLATHGGAYGVLDENLLESAIARPRLKAAYDGDVDLPALAASYAHAVVAGHPFVDGNKRVGLVAVFVFLGLNGWRLVADEISAVTIFTALASGALTEDDLADWIRANIAPR